MGDPADVGLVDAHPERDGRHHDQPVFLLKPCLCQPPRLGLHPAVIVQRHHPGLAQRLRQRFRLGPCAAVDDAGLTPPGGRKIEDLAPRFILDREGKVDVRPVEAAQEGGGRLPVKQPRDNLGLRLGVRRGGKCGQRHGQRATQLADAQVIGAEVVAPLADAMRLVHRDQPGVDAAQQRECAGARKPLRRHVEQFHPPFVQRLKHLFGFFVGVARGQRPGLDSRRAQGPHLIPHQRDQRRDDDRHPLAAERGQLKAQRLAAAGRHDGQRVLARQHRRNDLGLPRPEAGKAENRVQKRLGVGRHQP